MTFPQTEDTLGSQEERHRKNPNTPRKPRTWDIVERKKNYFGYNSRQRRPAGSWESAVWEDGEIVGYELNLQFDPNDHLGDDYIDDDEEDIYPESRFRPIGSDEYI